MINLKEYRQTTVITSLFMFCTFLFHPILAPYFSDYGVPDFYISMIFALFPAAIFLSSSVFGSLSDSLGRRTVIIFGIILQVVAIVLYLLGGTALFMAARIIEAVAFVCVILVGFARLQDSLEPATRGKYSGITLTVMQAGKMVSPVIGGLLADYVFVKAPFLFSMLCLIIMLWIMAIHERLGLNHKFHRADFNLFGNIRQFFSDRRLAGIGIMGFVMHATIPLTLVFIPLHITEYFGLEYRFVGYAFFAMQFFMLLQFYIGKLDDRFDKAKLVMIGACIIAVSFIILPFSQGYWVFIAVLVFASLGNAFWNVSCLAFLSDIGESENKEGFVVGTYMSVAKVGDFLSFVVGGFVFAAIGFTGVSIMLGGLVLVGCIIASCLIFCRTRTQKAGRKRR